MRTAVLVAIGLLAASPATSAPRSAKVKAPPENPRCASLAAGIDRSVKSAALDKATGASGGAADQAEIQNKLILARSLNCKPYAGSLSALAYAGPASSCYVSMLEARNANMRANGTDAAHSWPTETTPECEMSKWVAAPVD